MSNLHPDDAQEDGMPGLILTETPAAMSPRIHEDGQPISLPAHIAGLASDEDDWEDEEDEEDLDGLEQVGSSDSRRRWAEEEDEDDEEFARFAFGPGGSFGGAHNLRQRAMQEYRNSDRLLGLNPYKLSLSPADYESCVVLENAAFGPELAASKEKIAYRLRVASGLCIGLFTTVSPDSELTSLPTYATARPTETGSDRRTVLLGHILVTLTTNDKITDEDMLVPKSGNPNEGHKVGGRTIGLHSLAVLPEMQKARIGTTLMRTYIQMIQDSKVVDRISLITWEKLVPYYERLGFNDLGESDIKYGGKAWNDMVLVFPDDEDSEMS